MNNTYRPWNVPVLTILADNKLDCLSGVNVLLLPGLLSLFCKGLTLDMIHPYPVLVSPADDHGYIFFLRESETHQLSLFNKYAVFHVYLQSVYSRDLVDIKYTGHCVYMIGDGLNALFLVIC